VVNLQNSAFFARTGAYGYGRSTFPLREIYVNVNINALNGNYS